MAPWYREDSFLHPDNAEFDPTQSAPGKIGGVKPSPGTMAGPPDNAVRESFSTDETMEQRNETADMDDAVSPVATDANVGAPTVYSPGRDDDGEFEGEPGLYSPGNGADNLFGPSSNEEKVEGEDDDDDDDPLFGTAPDRTDAAEGLKKHEDDDDDDDDDEEDE